MTNWRPEGWKNPYNNHGAVLKEIGNEIAFESGADAMLEALKKEGRYGRRYMEAWNEAEAEGYRTKGWWVFIPEESDGS